MSDNLIHNVSSSKFWDERYISNNTGWDIGNVTPVFKDWCDSLAKSSKIFVPGCGNGYDPLYFADQGHDVLAVDISEYPINQIKKEAKKQNITIKALKCNIFDLNKNLFNQFDYVVEYTCFCAISPKKRDNYIDTMNKLLKAKGEFIALLFPLNKKTDDEGPPFHVNLRKTLNQFSSKFDLIESFKHPLSIIPRQDNEIYVHLRKK